MEEPDDDLLMALADIEETDSDRKENLSHLPASSAPQNRDERSPSVKHVVKPTSQALSTGKMLLIDVSEGKISAVSLCSSVSKKCCKVILIHIYLPCLVSDPAFLPAARKSLQAVNKRAPYQSTGGTEKLTGLRVRPLAPLACFPCKWHELQAWIVQCPHNKSLTSNCSRS
jgi:hypothetical protein